MIRIFGSDNSKITGIRCWKSTPFTWQVTTGGSYNVHIFNHNLGVVPNVVSFVRNTLSGTPNTAITGWENTGGTMWEYSNESHTTTQSTFRLHRPSYNGSNTECVIMHVPATAGEDAI